MPLLRNKFTGWILILGGLLYGLSWVEPVRKYESASGEVKTTPANYISTTAVAKRVAVTSPKPESNSSQEVQPEVSLATDYTASLNPFFQSASAHKMDSPFFIPQSELRTIDQDSDAAFYKSNEEFLERMQDAQRLHSFGNNPPTYSNRIMPSLFPFKTKAKEVPELAGKLSGDTTHVSLSDTAIAEIMSLLPDRTEQEVIVSGDVVHNGNPIQVGKDQRLTYTGEIHGAGGFTGEGVVAFAGSYRPGNSPAIIPIENKTIFTSTNTLTMEIGGLTPGPGTPTDNGYDQFLFSSASTPQVTWGGALVIDLINAFHPQPGQSFNFFDFDSSRDAGTFSSITLADGDTLDFDYTFDLSQIYITGVVTVVPEPGSTLLIASTGLCALFRLRSKQLPI